MPAIRFPSVARALVLGLALCTRPSLASAALAGPPIRGTVVDTAGNPLANVQVVATECLPNITGMVRRRSRAQRASPVRAR